MSIDLRTCAGWIALAGLLIVPAAYADVAPLPIDLSREQAKTLMVSAVAGIAILGFGMVALIWLGARFTQRYRHGSARFQPAERPGEHDWAKKPLEGKEPD